MATWPQCCGPVGPGRRPRSWPACPTAHSPVSLTLPPLRKSQPKGACRQEENVFLGFSGATGETYCKPLYRAVGVGGGTVAIHISLHEPHGHRKLTNLPPLIYLSFPLCLVGSSSRVPPTCSHNIKVTNPICANLPPLLWCDNISGP